MKLTKVKVSKIQQSVWNLEATLILLNDAGFDHNDMTYRKVKTALDELDYELENYELVSETLA